MGGIFISHSNKNNSEAERLREWLNVEGWGRSQVFLDLLDLKSGERWRDVLNSLSDKEAVIICLSDDWLKSPECLREFNLAEREKAVFLVRVAEITVPIPRFISDLQIVDTTDEGLLRLRDALVARKITPQSFYWPPRDEPNRAVYRGLQALEVQDAAVFFGRDGDLTRALDELRRLRSGTAQRAIIVLGASGAGKSSFLKAGLIARLNRDEENFLVLPVIRPDQAVISGPHGLSASLSAGLGRAVEARSIKDVADAFHEVRAPVIQRFNHSLSASGETFAGKPPTIVIAVDQFEELFGSENSERRLFCELLAGALEADGNAILLATIRSDSFSALQADPQLARIPQTLLNLPLTGQSSFREIIEGPARLASPPPWPSSFLSWKAQLTRQVLHPLGEHDQTICRIDNVFCVIELCAFVTQLFHVTPNQFHRLFEDFLVRHDATRPTSIAARCCTREGACG